MYPLYLMCVQLLTDILYLVLLQTYVVILTQNGAL